MARPQRNNIDYFPFFCDEGNKMFYLEETYGNDGFAVFIKLLRELAKTDFHYLDLSKKPKIMFLSAKCKVDSNTLESIINDLVELEKFDSELWNENKIIWCQDFIDSIQDAYSKRSNDCINRNSLLLLLDSKGIRKQSKSTRKPSLCISDSDVKPQSKVEYTKEEESRVKGDIDSIYSLYPSKCPINNSNTGKSKNNKDKIKTLLKEHSEDHLKYTINRYKDECLKDKRYMKNFGTFLNNLPDYGNEVDPHALDEKYTYFQWKNDPSIMARRVLKTEGNKYFEGQLMGGLVPVILKGIKNKNKTWK